jgi:hypothetical protein
MKTGLFEEIKPYLDEFSYQDVKAIIVKFDQELRYLRAKNEEGKDIERQINRKATCVYKQLSRAHIAYALILDGKFVSTTMVKKLDNFLDAGYKLIGAYKTPLSRDQFRLDYLECVNS